VRYEFRPLINYWLTAVQQPHKKRHSNGGVRRRVGIVGKSSVAPQKLMRRVEWSEDLF
jgi:hypothetical protein